MIKYIVEINDSGNKYYYYKPDNYPKEKILHREDGPAVEYSNGTKEWYKNGYLHREDGPAAEHSNGDKYWYKNGNSHREDGPAVECVIGTKYWYMNGIKYSEEEFLKKISPHTCEGKVVEIDGKKYKLSLI